jgi:hypothetical protein
LTRFGGRLAVALGLAVACAACTIGTTFKGTPADLYSVIPSQSDVRKLMGDDGWWAGPPSFEVKPLDYDITPATETFAIGVEYLHLGSAEMLFARYAVYDKSSSATTVMNDYKTAYGTSPSTPRVGDQVLYYAAAGSGAAPYVARTFVRVGQIVVQVAWSRKDGEPDVNRLGKVAEVFAGGLRNISKAHASLQQPDKKFLPPPGLDVTPLGSAVLPIEAFAVMLLAALPGPLVDLLHSDAVNTFAYGDYVLNNDVHMEVQTALLTFPSSTIAADWASGVSPGTPDSNGIAAGYIPTGGSPAGGEYHFVFATGVYGAELICKPSVEGEAASRECEDPVGRTALAWKSALGG